MGNLRESFCYVDHCENPANTVEHAPARVFFPEQGDAGINYRERMVTVPACREHNSAYAKDDEYVAYTMHAHIRTNQAALRNFDTKILRAMERNIKLIDHIYKNRRLAWLPEGSKLRRRAIFDVDKARVDRVMRRIASALYYKTQKRRVAIDSDRYLVYSPDTISPTDLKSDFPQEIEAYLASKTCYISLPLWNQEIFSCDYHIDSTEQERFVFRFTFYGNFKYRVIH